MERSGDFNRRLASIIAWFRMDSGDSRILFTLSQHFEFKKVVLYSGRKTVLDTALDA